jgi:hypothetical protein
VVIEVDLFALHLHFEIGVLGKKEWRGRKGRKKG